MKATVATALGNWELTGHAMERFIERNPFSEEEFLEALVDPRNVKVIMRDTDKRRVLTHVLAYVKGLYFVVVLSQWVRSPLTMVVTLLSEDSYRRQIYAVNLSIHIEHLARSRKKQDK